MMNSTPSTACSHFHPTSRRPIAINSFTPAKSKTTPNNTPTDATDVMLNRNTITEISNHRIPVTRNSHHMPEAARAAILEELSMHPPCRTVPLQSDLRMLPRPGGEPTERALPRDGVPSRRQRGLFGYAATLHRRHGVSTRGDRPAWE